MNFSLIRNISMLSFLEELHGQGGFKHGIYLDFVLNHS